MDKMGSTKIEGENIENCHCETSEELYHVRRHNMELASAIVKLERMVWISKEEVRISNKLHQKEQSWRKEIQVEKSTLESDLEMLKTEGTAVSKELEMIRSQYLAYQSEAIHSKQGAAIKIKKLEDKYLKEIEQLRTEIKNVELISGMGPSYLKVSHHEIQEATNFFDRSLKIGGGGYGSVYKGFLRHTPVAIKILDSGSMQGMSEFYKEVEILSRMRHPHLVTLIGACPEAHALVYEFLPNGSLDDRLECNNNSQPLNWKVRIRIIAEICSALIFLHSSTPLSVIHGDIKPSNILLDANLVSKLGDFGISMLLPRCNAASSSVQVSNPQGTFRYMDPTFLETGRLTTYSDVYSFGLLILCLLTRRHEKGVVNQVREAFIGGYLHSILDSSAGDWPFLQAKNLAHLGLQCCEEDHKNRPSLADEVWKVVVQMKEAYFPMSCLKSSNLPPSHFICPIFQDVMVDPHMAADGYTYEGEAIRGWFDSGQHTSPMTNAKLPNFQLCPNRALQSEIQIWHQQQR